MPTKENTIFHELSIKNEERQLCEVYTRVMGYFRPISEFNIGKIGEYYERTCFKEPN